jgi:hypothetical protein
VPNSTWLCFVASLLKAPTASRLTAMVLRLDQSGSGSRSG